MKRLKLKQNKTKIDELMENMNKVRPIDLILKNFHSTFSRVGHHLYQQVKIIWPDVTNIPKKWYV